MEAAYQAGRRTLAYFNTGVPVEIKSDDTPVTQADREAEALIREIIQRYYPDHAILGEEGGSKEGNPAYKWIIDPIDGTKSFIHGAPLYGVLIGVEVAGKPSVGVIYLPALDEMIGAATGHGCWWNGRRARVSSVSELADATVVTSSITTSLARSDAFAKLVKSTRLVRTWGDAFGYAMVATGRADIAVDPIMNPWDCGPMLTILEEAGGHFTTWKGEATIWGKDGVATNHALHNQVIEILKKG